MGQYSQLKPHGWFEVFNDWGDTVAGESVQCVHCGGHFVKSPGSGKLRGFCTRCNGFVCGPECAECVPQELLLERLESGMDMAVATTMPRPAIVNVPREIKGGGILG